MESQKTGSGSSVLTDSHQTRTGLAPKEKGHVQQDEKESSEVFLFLQKQDSFDRLGAIGVAGRHKRAPAKHVRSGPKPTLEMRFSFYHLFQFRSRPVCLHSGTLVHEVVIE